VGASVQGPPETGLHPGRVFRPVLVLILVLGVAVLGLYALKQAATPPSGLAVFSALVMLTASAVAVGALLGFLFGIPKSLQNHAR
jgi:asparagine N-glycosylation enzyme membrane subunit Stt3